MTGGREGSGKGEVSSQGLGTEAGAVGWTGVDEWSSCAAYWSVLRVLVLEARGSLRAVFRSSDPGKLLVVWVVRENWC